MGEAEGFDPPKRPCSMAAMVVEDSAKSIACLAGRLATGSGRGSSEKGWGLRDYL
jgi:hypothetical protein